MAEKTKEQIIGELMGKRQQFIKSIGDEEAILKEFASKCVELGILQLNTERVDLFLPVIEERIIPLLKELKQIEESIGRYKDMSEQRDTVERNLRHHNISL